MFFLFGTTDRERTRGEVADRCPHCRRLSFFVVSDHYRVWHAYFIPLGRGKFQGTTRSCTSCGARIEIDPGRYAELLEPGSAGTVSLDEAIRRTNPGLARTLDAVWELERLAEQHPYRGPDDERGADRLRTAARWLRELVERDVDVSAFTERFARWRQLSPEERGELFAELKGYARAMGVSR